MVSNVYPLGHPEEGDVDELDRRLLELQAGTRRRRSMFEPPDTVIADPWLVPERLWRSVQADDIRRQGASMAVLQDGRDISFNVQVETERERAVERIPPVTRVPPPSLAPPAPKDIIVEARRISGIDRPGPLAVTLPEQAPAGTLAARLRHAFGTSQGLDALDLLSAHRQAERDVTRERDRVGAADPVAFAEALDRERRLRESVSILGPLTASQRGGLGQLVGGVLRPVAETLDLAFDGKRFIGHLTIQTVAAARWLGGTEGSMAELREQAGRDFDGLFEELPRPVQIGLEEMSPGNLAIVLSGGLLAPMLAARGGKAGLVLSRFVEPMAAGWRAYPTEVAVITTARSIWEGTEGAPGA
ncbi:hypothetical protein LCGC14_1915870, partial [marine sediment metagenome]